MPCIDHVYGFFPSVAGSPVFVVYYIMCDYNIILLKHVHRTLSNVFFG